MIVAGIDYGVRRVAFASPQASSYHVLDLHSPGDRAAELSALQLFTQTCVEQTGAEYVLVEHPIVGASGNRLTGVSLGMSAGALLVGAYLAGASAALVTPSEWKKGTVGRGNADKTEVAGWLCVHHYDIFESCHDDQDLIDASCMALYAVQMEA